MSNASVKVQTDAGSVHIAVSGEIDLANAAAVENEILGSIDNRASEVVVDLTDLWYMDSSGLRILFLLANRLDVLQIAMAVIAPPGSPTRRVIQLSGFDALVQLRP